MPFTTQLGIERVEVYLYTVLRLYVLPTTTVLAPTYPPVQLAPAYCREQRGRSVRLTPHLYLVPKLRIREAIPTILTCLHGVHRSIFYCASMMLEPIDRSWLKPNFSTCYLNDDRELWSGPFIRSCTSIPHPHTLLPITEATGHQSAIHSQQTQIIS
jgi:hypothetical protein